MDVLQVVHGFPYVYTHSTHENFSSQQIPVISPRVGNLKKVIKWHTDCGVKLPWILLKIQPLVFLDQNWFIFTFFIFLVIKSWILSSSFPLALLHNWLPMTTIIRSLVPQGSLISVCPICCYHIKPRKTKFFNCFTPNSKIICGILTVYKTKSLL